MRPENFGGYPPLHGGQPSAAELRRLPQGKKKFKLKGRKATPAGWEKLTAVRSLSGDLLGYGRIARRGGDLILLDARPFHDRPQRASAATLAGMLPESMTTPSKAADMEMLVRQARARMASMPAVSGAAGSRFENRHTGQSYICLPHEGKRLIPRFQVNEAGELDSFVQEVNQLLGAVDDPWGVMAWWTRHNVWLGSSPLALLETGRREAIVTAARSAVSEE